MTSCKKIADLIGAYIYGDLAPDEMRMVRLHVEKCESCARELEFRSKTLALIPTETPTLSDEERQRIMWTVKGAVRAKTQPARSGIFTPRFAWGVAASVLLIAAFTSGAYVGFRAKSTKEKVITKQAPAPNKAPIIKEKPESIVKESDTHTGPPIIPENGQLTASGPPPLERAIEVYRGDKSNKRHNGRSLLKPDDTMDENSVIPNDNAAANGLPLAPEPNLPGSIDLGGFGKPNNQEDVKSPVDNQNLTPSENPAAR